MGLFDFRAHPGNLFVIATLLPLASFVLLLVAGAVRTFLRSNRESGFGSNVYRWLGGENPGKGPAYVASAAIGLACLLCVIGFITFLNDPALATHGHTTANHQQEHGEQKADEEHAVPKVPHEELAESRWAGSISWARVLPAYVPDKENGTTLTLGYRIDSLACVMFCMVTFIATLIHVFSIGYMGDELAPVVEDHQVHTEHGHLHRRGRFGRFFMFLSLFCFSMLNLVLADNLFQVFLSWELVGICSYLLIGHYYERNSASNASNKAFITNRIGDAGFIIGLLILWSYLGTLNFQDVFKQIRAPMKDADGVVERSGQFIRADWDMKKTEPVLRVSAPDTGSELVLFPRQPNMGGDHASHFHAVDEAGQKVPLADAPKASDYRTMPYWLLIVAGLGIFLGCVGKSAQFPLHVWLPDAMEGPTPVSALIHAATMVAAGVYLVGRVFPLFTPESRLVIAYTGGITLFVAATIAIVMTDIKKVLAYSTVSQLGYMMLALGVGGWAAGLFHLVTHAFFKALLFLGSGSVIYGCHHEQEMTKMGGLYPKMKITALTMLVGVLTIAGIPLFSGWYSKDAILANALGFAVVHREHFLLFLLPLVTAGITAFYMSRMWLMTFTGKPRDEHVYEHAHESPRPMTVPLIILAVFSVIVAWGWPIYDAEKSALEAQIHHAQHESFIADFGAGQHDPKWAGGFVRTGEKSERWMSEEYHHTAGNLALGLVLVGVLFGYLLYYKRVLDPAEAQEQFPGVYRFLQNKWYFDELYSVLLVRPALVVATWCRAFDTRVIDGTVNWLARFGVKVSKWDGRFDLGVVDGLVNLTADVIHATGARLRNVQTGYLRSYILFLVLAAVAIFAVLSYFVSRVAAG